MKIIKAHLDKGNATVTDETGSILAIEHEIIQNAMREKDNSANIVSPLENLVPVGAIMGHVSESFILEHLEEVVNRSMAFEGNASRASESWSQDGGRSRHGLAEDA